MPDFKQLRQGISLLLVLFLLAPPGFSRSRKGDKLMKQGKDAEQNRQYEAALQFYEGALASDPKDTGYQILVYRARLAVSQVLIDRGTKARSEGRLEEARDFYVKALQLDSSSSLAAAEWRRTNEMIEKNANLPAAERGLTPAEMELKRSEARIATLAAPPELKPISRQIQSLKMNNQPLRVLYETVCKLAGLNVIFDPQFQNTGGRNFNVDLNNSTVEDALEYIGVLTKTFWKPISPNTIFVAEDNVTKRRDYDDDVVKVLYVNNASSVQEFQELSTAVRSILEMRRVYTYNAQKAMVVRGSADQVALAEKLLRDLDKPKAEVIVDIILLEANRGRVRDLAAALTPAGINQPIVYVPGQTVGTGEDAVDPKPMLLSQLKISTNQYATTLPSALLQALVTDRQSKVVQSPQVRASDGQKVVLHIGDRIPIATGSFQPGFGGVGSGISPLVSTQFQLLEVGVKVEITPQVHGTEEVTLKLNMEVSQVRDRVDLGGIQQPIIGQRRSEAELRLRNGEVNILGGLSNMQDSRTRSGIPGIIDVPVLNRLFSSENVDRSQQELLIALVPRIVRTPGYTADNLRTVLAGSDQVVRVRYNPRADEPAPTTPAAKPPASTTPTPPPTEAAKPEEPKPAAGETNQAAGAPVLSFSPATEVQTQPSGTVTVSLLADRVKDLFAAGPIRIKFNPALLRLNDVVAGDLLQRDGKSVTISKDIRNDAGEATISITRVAGAGGVTGNGAICTLSFLATARGSAPIQVEDLNLVDAQMQPIKATNPAPTGVRIQ